MRTEDKERVKDKRERDMVGRNNNGKEMLGKKRKIQQDAYI